MSDRYVEIDKEYFETLVIKEMGFEVIPMPNTFEVVYTRKIDDNYSMYIYSSIDKATGITRNCGDDAIRIVIGYRDENNNIKLTSFLKRVYRTKSALPNTLTKSRELWKEFKHAPRCNKCGNLLVERRNSKTNEKFMGCVNWKNH